MPRRKVTNASPQSEPLSLTWNRKCQPEHLNYCIPRMSLQGVLCLRISRPDTIEKDKCIFSRACWTLLKVLGYASGSKHIRVKKKNTKKQKNNQNPKLPQSWVSDDSPASCAEGAGDALSVTCHSGAVFLPPKSCPCRSCSFTLHSHFSKDGCSLTGAFFNSFC